MRRGHNGLGGWRNENPRHFRSRSGGNPHFGSSRSYDHPVPPRFPPPSSRSGRPPYHPHHDKFEQDQLEYADRNRYRHNRYSYHRPQHQNDRHIQPLLQTPRHNGDRSRLTFKESSAFTKDVIADNFHVNSMGDIDQRQVQHFMPPVVNPWADSNVQPVIEGGYNKSHTHNHGSEVNETNKFSTEYTGHRPPASDQFGCNPTHSFSSIDNSRSFSRSVDDTVDLIRKKLLNRNEQQQSCANFNTNQSLNSDIDERIIDKSSNITIIPNNQETPSKRKNQKQSIHSIDKSNCAKIKNKIVHQLFKMDKDKIHKLMDNPNSSTKFEYAISSLITESQNSFNRHLRSAAEKTLSSSSAEFIENDNNTIYEDTFMKQMQCILDPQDTIFLEDIKPIVMAELSKVLQIDEYEQKYDISDVDNAYSHHSDQHTYNEYTDNDYPYEQYPEPTDPYEHEYPQKPNYFQTDDSENLSTKYSYENNSESYEQPKPLYERRERRKSYNLQEEASTALHNPFYNQTHSEPLTDEDRSEIIQPIFNVGEQLSEDDDPFAELDNQYHVAVDHDFIEQDDISLPNDLPKKNSYNIKPEPKLPDKNTNSYNIKAEPKSPDKNTNSYKIKTEPGSPNKNTKQEGIGNRSKENTQTRNKPDCKPAKCNDSLQSKPKNTIDCSSKRKVSTQDNNLSSTSDSQKEKTNSGANEMTNENKVDHTVPAIKSATEHNPRKRSTDQRPSHRKEKRKKVESCSSETNKQILNKNIIINVNDCASKAEKGEASKSVFNLFFSKEESKTISKESEKITLNDKNYIEKHVKRRETPKKICGKEAKTRKDSTSSQPTSPNDTKTTLKTIDMFTEQPKKINIHQAHRNTAQAPAIIPKLNIENVPKPKGPISKQLIKRHVAVQVLRKVHTKEIQTDLKKFAVKAIQTDIIPERSGTKATDAFERMKEIDLEIQVLLQEKFKLYSSLENKDSGTNSMQNLGMAVLNVEQLGGDENVSTEDILQEDEIVADFANIPVEELEQIALETVQVQENEEKEESTKVAKRNRRRKISYQDSIPTRSPVTVSKRKNRKVKSPNISLIEQIITDDRPLEDIISLDDLEVPNTPTSCKRPKVKHTSKKKGIRKAKVTKPNISNIDLKQCSVVLIRADLSNYVPIYPQQPEQFSSIVFEESREDQTAMPHFDDTDIVVESVDNQIQIDMLDVSEDIVVGDSCELKSLEDKVDDTVSVPISEEIILDNSQSSMEDVLTPALCQGGECKMYDYSADENLRRDSVVVSGNADAVLAIECIENNFLAACLDGNVYYFSGEGQLITTLRGSNLAVTCLTIVKEKYGTTVYTGSLDSRIRYYDLETGLEKGPECNVLSPIQTMDRAWDTVFVGTRTGFVLQFECKNNMLIPVSTVKFSDQSILALIAMKEGPRKVLLVAARSENVTIKDAQTGLLLRTLAGPKMTVYTLLYEDGKVYCGTSSHQIHVFDYTSGSHVGSHEGGKGAVCLRAAAGLLFAGCYDGCVYVYREGEGRPFAQLRGPSLMLLSLAVLGTKIIAGYKDRSLYIWKIPLCILQEMIL